MPGDHQGNQDHHVYTDSVPDEMPNEPASEAHVKNVQRARLNLWFVVLAMLFAIGIGALFIVGSMLFVVLRSDQPENAAPEPQVVVVSQTTPTPSPVTIPITVSTVAGIDDVQHLTEGTVGPAVFAPGGAVFAVATGPDILIYQTSPLALHTILKGGNGGHTNDINALAFSPVIEENGMVLLASSAVHETEIQVWDAGSGQRLQTLGGHSDWIRSLAFSPDGRWLASGSADTTINLWEITGYSAQNPRALSGHTDMVSQVAFSPDSSLLASTSRDGSVRLWDTAQGTARPDAPFFEAPTDPTTDAPYWTTGVAFRPDGEMLAVGTTEGVVRLLSLQDGSVLHTLNRHTSLIVLRGLAFHPDGETLASASLDGTVYLWDTRTGEETGRFDHQGMEIVGVCFSSDGTTMLTSSSMSGEVLVWETDSGTLAQRLPLAQGPVISLAYSLTSDILGTTGRNGVIRLHFLHDTRMILLTGAAPTSQSIAFLTPQDLAVAYESDPGSAVLYDLTQPESPQTLMFMLGSALSVATSPDATLVALGGSNGEVMLWDVSGEMAREAFTGIAGGIAAMVFSSDSSIVAASNTITTVTDTARPAIGVWDVGSGELRTTLHGHTGRITGLAIHPDGTLLASTSTDGTLRLWDIATGEAVRVIEADDETEHYTSVAFSPDGSLLVTGNPYGVLTFWNPATGTVVHTQETYGGPVLQLAFRPDGRQLAVSLERGGIWLYENHVNQDNPNP